MNKVNNLQLENMKEENLCTKTDLFHFTLMIFPLFPEGGAAGKADISLQSAPVSPTPEISFLCTKFYPLWIIIAYLTSQQSAHLTFACTTRSFTPKLVLEEKTGSHSKVHRVI